MRRLRLGRAFDAVFDHDAVDYTTTADDLRQAIETAHWTWDPDPGDDWILTWLRLLAQAGCSSPHGPGRSRFAAPGRRSRTFPEL